MSIWDLTMYDIYVWHVISEYISVYISDRYIYVITEFDFFLNLTPVWCKSYCFGTYVNLILQYFGLTISYDH